MTPDPVGRPIPWFPVASWCAAVLAGAFLLWIVFAG
jgi:hypothetical protein